mgnify:CR=1 FL=1
MLSEYSARSGPLRYVSGPLYIQREVDEADGNHDEHDEELETRVRARQGLRESDNQVTKARAGHNRALRGQ